MAGAVRGIVTSVPRACTECSAFAPYDWEQHHSCQKVTIYVGGYIYCCNCSAEQVGIWNGDTGRAEVQIGSDASRSHGQLRRNSMCASYYFCEDQPDGYDAKKSQMKYSGQSHRGSPKCTRCEARAISSARHRACTQLQCEPNSVQAQVDIQMTFISYPPTLEKLAPHSIRRALSCAT